MIRVSEAASADRRRYRLLDQIEASATSIAANIAEGKGRFSQKEFSQHLYIARGSLYETVTFLEIFRRMEWLAEEEHARLKEQGLQIGAMLKGLINALA